MTLILLKSSFRCSQSVAFSQCQIELFLQNIFQYEIKFVLFMEVRIGEYTQKCPKNCAKYALGPL